MKICYALLLSLLLQTPLWADDDIIEFPEEELATESVLPVFEKPRSVLNRNIVMEKRFEVGAGIGLALNEPFYNPLNYGFSATYHFSDIHAANFVANMNMSGLSTYGEQLRSGANGVNFDPAKAPTPQYTILGNYQFTAYYGKISLSKQAVMNMTFYGLGGIGLINFEDVNAITLNFGIGQSYYFSQKFALRFDLRILMFNGPDATSKSLGPTDNPKASDFDDRLFFNTQLGLSGVFVL